MKRPATLLASVAASILFGTFPAWTESAETTQKPAADGQKATAKTSVLDINTASVDELKAIRGINEATAKKIIEGRPYKRKVELVTKKIIPQESFDKIKSQIVAKQPNKS